MSEIVIPKRYIILSLVLIGLVAAAVWFAPQLYGGSLAQAGEADIPLPRQLTNRKLRMPLPGIPPLPAPKPFTPWTIRQANSTGWTSSAR